MKAHNNICLVYTKFNARSSGYKLYIYRFLCGVLVFDSVSRSRSRPLRPASPTIFHTQLCHTLSFTHNFVTHSHSLSHATLSHTLFHTPSLSHTLFHAQLCHTLSFTLSLSHTIFHTQLCHTPSFTHNFVTHSFKHSFVTHSLSHTTFLRTLFHTPSLSHTLFHTLSLSHTTSTFDLRGRRGTWRHLPSLCVAGVALGDIRPHFVWQALTWRHHATSTIVSRDRRGSYGTGLALVARLGAAWAPLVAR